MTDFVTFWKKKEILFSLQFGFRQKYSPTHALIHLTDMRLRLINVTMLLKSL